MSTPHDPALAPVVMQATEVVALSSKIGSIMDLINMFKNFNLAQIGALLAALKAFSDAVDLKGRVVAAVGILVAAAKMTITEVDDKLVAMLNAVLTPEMIDVLVRLVGGMLGGAQAQDATMAAADRATATAFGFDWAFLTKIALAIVELLGWLKVAKPAEAI